MDMTKQQPLRSNKQEDFRHPPVYVRFTRVHTRTRQFEECHHTHNNSHSTTTRSTTSSNKAQYDNRQANQTLPPLLPGKAVWIPGFDREGDVQEQVFGRSYLISTDTSVVRRNCHNSNRLHTAKPTTTPVTVDVEFQEAANNQPQQPAHPPRVSCACA